jgi:hypothetical protein
LVKGDTRDPAAILNSSPNEILDNVKKLIFSAIEPHVVDYDTFEVRWDLLELLGALPRDSLTAFTCNEYTMDKTSLLLLLRNQTKISELSVRLDRFGCLPRTDLIKDALSSLGSLSIQVSGANQSVHGKYDDWFPHTPNLRKLRIKGI